MKPNHAGTRHVVAALFFLALTLCAGAQGSATPQAESSPHKGFSGPWTIRYSVEGGIAGRNEHLTLQQDGQAEVTGRPGKTSFQISAGQLARIAGIVQNLDLSATTAPAKPKNVPDMLYSSLTITYDGREHPIGPDGKNLAIEVQSIMSEGLRRAEDEKWIKAGPFRPGRTWQVSEEVRDGQGLWHGELWVGTWTRRGDSNTFDAVWHNNKSNQELRDAVVLDSAGRGKIAMHRQSSDVKYDGWYRAERQDDITGYITPHPNCTWRVTISY
jgi:hypothetical protein